MAGATRSKVLSVFKDLHRTRKVVFRGDDHTQAELRKKINEEFRKNCKETNPETINQLIVQAADVNVVLKTQVLQFKEVRPNVYQMREGDLKDKCMDAKVGCGRPDCHCVPQFAT